jgi:translation initiation factor 5B
MKVAALDEGDTDKPKKKVVYDNKKKKRDAENRAKEEQRKLEEEEAKLQAEKRAALGDDDDDVADNWDDDVADDWDAESDDDKLAEKLGADLEVPVETKEWDPDASEEEDEATSDLKKEQARLAQLGREREKREKEEAAKMAELRKKEEEANMKELMAMQLIEEGKKRREKREQDNLDARSRDNLRCPIIVIMGHVDTGKTKLLDNIRRTNVQEGEAGGITQQIGATYFEQGTLEKRFEKLNSTEKYPFNLPGIQVIDTPGHESFSNLRSRGSNLCDLAILVVDLMHGLEQQTIESLNMLRAKKCPFVVALNKIDRCYDWKTCPNDPIREALAVQPEGTVQEYKGRIESCKMQLQEQGVNSNLYWEMGDNDWMNSDFVPLVPTSAISGEGVQDILWLLCKIAQEKMWQNLMYCANLQATVLEVKAIDGMGMTVDVIVVNGVLREGDKIVLCSMDGPVVSEIRGLLTPPPSREMRVKADYQHHKEVKGAMGVKLIGNNFDKVMAGTPVMVVGEDDTEEDIVEEVMSDLRNLTTNLQVDKKGVMVQASTLGALEALLQFLRVDTQPPIPVSHVGIGTIFKKDVTKISIMKDKKGCEEYATILAFDVPVDKEAKEFAEKENVKIFTADIIYHLFDHFTRHMEEIAEKRRADAAAVAVFPCIVKILPQHIFNQKDPIIVGMEVVEGILKVGTPLCVPALGGLMIGNVTSIEQNGKEQITARKGASVAVKIVNESNPNITYGRQFDSTKNLYSFLTRGSIDALKLNFKDALENEDWRLVVKLKKIYNII